MNKIDLTFRHERQGTSRWVAMFCLASLALLMSENVFAVSRKVTLGQKLFADADLSSPPGQACASCHSPEHFFVDPDSNEPTSEGVIEGRYGSRNAPTLFYASSSPPFHFNKEEGLFIGGQFDDGRALNLQAQAKQPFLEALEMNNKSPEEVVEKVRVASYAPLFRSVYGDKSLDDPTTAYQRIVDAISAFEKTAALNPFRSKYDRYMNGAAKFTPSERRGREIFERKDKGNCAACHPSRPSENGKQRPLFTDHSYDNLGVPRNPENPFYSQAKEFNPKGYEYVDIGLGDHIQSVDERGKFKVPTLRNIAKTAPYMHNGYFKTLRGVINFYNTRDIKPTCPDRFTTEEKAMAMGCWPVPEVQLNENHDELGSLGLTTQEELDLEAFLNTLTDDL
ncbi:MAG: hypothetical protein RLZ25_573 [Pseudomonadota bacterium]